jgi:hypothetical protein
MMVSLDKSCYTRNGGHQPQQDMLDLGPPWYWVEQPFITVTQAISIIHISAILLDDWRLGQFEMPKLKKVLNF